MRPFTYSRADSAPAALHAYGQMASTVSETPSVHAHTNISPAAPR
jgi:hypothetical protein